MGAFPPLYAHFPKSPAKLQLDFIVIVGLHFDLPFMLLKREQKKIGIRPIV